jgi:hypothetical protein
MKWNGNEKQEKNYKKKKNRSPPLHREIVMQHSENNKIKIKIKIKIK